MAEIAESDHIGIDVGQQGKRQWRDGKIEMAVVERHESRYGNMAVCGGGKQHPDPENRNARDCRRDDGMIKTVVRRYYRMI